MGYIFSLYPTKLGNFGVNSTKIVGLRAKKVKKSLTLNHCKS